MAVYRIDLSYDGSGFRGYARQDDQRTVQGVLEDALAVLLKGPVTTSVAGRTDAGVHALGQVVSFEYPDELDPRITRSLNGILGPEVSVRAVNEASSGFNARFSATCRRYRYLIDQTSSQNPLTRSYVWHVGQSLDVTMMSSVGEVFVGKHDFTSFCRSHEGKSNERNVNELTLTESEGSLEFWIEANSFCHQMVRSIVGYLYDVGRGYSDGSLAEEVIAGRDRGVVGTVAPAHGLTLMSVGYE